MEGIGLTILGVKPSKGPLMLSTGMAVQLNSRSTGTVHVTHFPSEESFWPKDHRVIRFTLRLRMTIPLPYTVGRMGVQLAPCSSYLGNTVVIIRTLEELMKSARGSTFKQKIGQFTVKFRVRYVERWRGSVDYGSANVTPIIPHEPVRIPDVPSSRPSFLPPMDKPWADVEQQDSTLFTMLDYNTECSPKSPVSQCSSISALLNCIRSPLIPKNRGVASDCQPAGSGNHQSYSRVYALRELNSDPSMGWAPALASDFNLRVGPNYLRNGTKAPSMPSLYDCVFADVIRCSQMNLNCVNRLIPPPKTFLGEAPRVHDIPPYLVMNLLIPLRGPLDWFAADEGFCSVVIIGRVSDAAVNLHEDNPGLMLWRRYLDHGNEERTESASASLLLKFVLKLENFEDLYIPPWARPTLTRYNGKPVLLQKESVMRTEDDWVELSINANKVNPISRSLMTKLRKEIKLAQFSLGVCIQGVEDDELPERLLIGAKMQHVDLEGAAHIST